MILILSSGKCPSFVYNDSEVSTCKVGELRTWQIYYPIPTWVEPTSTFPK